MSTKVFPTSISFSGCGFLGVYHIGLIRCFQVHGSRILGNIVKFAGASAGSLAATMLAVCPGELMRCKQITYELAKTVRQQRLGALTAGFRLSTHVEKLIDQVLPSDAHELATDRVFISVTRKKCGKNFIVSNFSSRSDLIECLVSSCHIPVYSGRKLPIFRGEKFYDGGFTNNLVDFGNDEETLFVTPFSGGLSYICPEDSIGKLNVTVRNQNFCVNTKNLWRGMDAVMPPSTEVLDSYYKEGYMDGLRYLARMSKQHPDSFILSHNKIDPRIHQRLDSLLKRKRCRSQSEGHSNSSKTSKPVPKVSIVGSIVSKLKSKLQKETVKASESESKSLHDSGHSIINETNQKFTNSENKSQVSTEQNFESIVSSKVSRRDYFTPQNLTSEPSTSKSTMLTYSINSSNEIGNHQKSVDSEIGIEPPSKKSKLDGVLPPMYSESSKHTREFLTKPTLKSATDFLTANTESALESAATDSLSFITAPMLKSKGELVLDSDLSRYTVANTHATEPGE